MNLFARSPERCAKVFNVLLAVCLLRIILAGIFFLFHWPILLLLPLGLLLCCLVGALAYQTGYPPLLAGFLSAAVLLPYLGTLLLLVAIVQGRYHLQNRNYLVGFFGPRQSPQPQPSMAVIPWHQQWKWPAVFLGTMLILFSVMWILDAEYAEKFFQLFRGHPWIGVALLAVVFSFGLLMAFLGIELRRLRTLPARTAGIICQMVCISGLVVLFYGISFAIVLLTPAVYEMLASGKMLANGN